MVKHGELKVVHANPALAQLSWPSARCPASAPTFSLRQHDCLRVARPPTFNVSGFFTGCRCSMAPASG